MITLLFFLLLVSLSFEKTFTFAFAFQTSSSSFENTNTNIINNNQKTLKQTNLNATPPPPPPKPNLKEPKLPKKAQPEATIGFPPQSFDNNRFHNKQNPWPSNFSTWTPDDALIYARRVSQYSTGSPWMSRTLNEEYLKMRDGAVLRDVYNIPVGLGRFSVSFGGSGGGGMEEGVTEHVGIATVKAVKRKRKSTSKLEEIPPINNKESTTLHSPSTTVTTKLLNSLSPALKILGKICTLLSYNSEVGLLTFRYYGPAKFRGGIEAYSSHLIRTECPGFMREFGVDVGGEGEESEMVFNVRMEGGGEIGGGRDYDDQ